MENCYKDFTTEIISNKNANILDFLSRNKKPFAASEIELLKEYGAFIENIFMKHLFKYLKNDDVFGVFKNCGDINNKLLERWFIRGGKDLSEYFKKFDNMLQGIDIKRGYYLNDKNLWIWLNAVHLENNFIEEITLEQYLNSLK